MVQDSSNPFGYKIDWDTSGYTEIENSTAGDLPIWGAGGIPDILPIGSANQFLGITAGLPAWKGAGFIFKDSSTSDATTYTDADGTYTQVKSLTFAPTASNNYIFAVGISANIRNVDTASTASARLSISDGTNKIQVAVITSTNSGSFVARSAMKLLDNSLTALSGSNVAMQGQASYALTVDLKEDTPTGGTNAEIKDIVLDVYYTDGITVTTSSAKFT